MKLPWQGVALGGARYCPAWRQHGATIGRTRSTQGTKKKNKAMPNFTLSLGRIRPANTRKSTGDAAGCEADCLILISQHTSRQPTDENLRQQVGLYFFF